MRRDYDYDRDQRRDDRAVAYFLALCAIGIAVVVFAPLIVIVTR